MRKYRLILLLFLFAFSVRAQQGNPTILSGTVVNSKTKEPLEGASIRLKGSTNEVITDKKGQYKLVTYKQAPHVLTISFVGFASSEVQAQADGNQISLIESATQLNEAVVVGYGTQRKADLTGSIAKISAADIKKIPVSSFDGQLQGKAAGLQVITNSGVPGEGVFVRVRGTTSINSSSDPLYIVDGVFLNNTSLQTMNMGGRTTSPIADINPADIESIEVLKDASATAIYGSRGANGVVIVTTKKGSYNSKPKISFDVSNGWVQADKSTLPVLASGPETAELANEYWINSGIDKPSLNQTYANRPFRPKSEGGLGLPEEQNTYDRIGDLTHKGYVQDYNIGVQGGNNNSKYYIGAGYSDQQSFVRVLSFNRASLKFNFDQKLSDRISIGLTNSLSRSYRNQARTGDGPQVSLWNSANSAATYTPKYADDGTSVGADNTYVLMENYNVNTVTLRYIGSIYGEAQLAQGLKFKSSFSLDHNNYDESAYWNSKTSIGKASNGSATSAITQNTTWIAEQLLSYQKKFGLHNLIFLAGNTIQSNTIALTSADGQGFANDNYQLISSASVRNSSQGWTRSTLVSFFGRASYNFLNKYYAEATLRTDASSKFGANSRWGYFPAFSAGWRLKEEGFLRDVSWISDLKVRGSWGITGNQSGINNFAAQGLWTGSGSYADIVGTPLAGIGPYQLGNDDLRWEKTAQTNVGFDLALFNSRLNVTLDLYKKYTSDLLLQQPLPSSSGFSSYWANIGEISNKGYELTINSVNIRSKGFTWTTSLNISGNRNRIEKLPSQLTRYTRDWVIMKEGYEMNSFWLYNQLYVDPKTGAPVFEGQDGNGAVTADDRKIVHSAYPKYYGGIYNNFSYKGFDLGIQFNFQYGNYSLNLNRYFRERNPLSGGVNAKVLERWTPDNINTDVPRLTSVGNNYTIDQNSRYLEDASFLRLKQLSLAYNLPPSVLRNLRLTNVRIFALGTNLKLWSKYTGDPESNVTSDPTAQGIGSFGTPPQPMGFQFGFNVTL
ncbi:SusC/RagA family TonB-linked outer membrane protein [Flavihumibacter petaseus]|uniref:Putative TonB-dependent receptor n=1 Tax=Flavihumibacter petaseus NBRC 106054 TaxID=1220578 RepID=A0A0E9MYB6_9BACT|nr:TonB-dependent receptor [Flavihumibacter petaseus]GAO42493.1 putative TonB-dependent receptor [Flavihumibacter petaseus NBRC 106054]